MRELLNNIKYDLKLQLFTKSFYILGFVFVLIFLITHFNQVNKYNSHTDLYIKSYMELKEVGEDPEVLLKQEYKIEETKDEKGGILQFIDNHLKYDFENMKLSRQDITGINIVTSLLKNSILIFLSLTVAIYMIYISCFEFSQRTIKNRILMGKLPIVLVSKFISGLIIVTCIYFFTLIVSAILSYFWSNIVISKSSVSVKVHILELSSVFNGVFISYIILLFYIITGFLIGILLRKSSLAILLFTVLHLIVPSLGKYDYKNMIFNIYNYGFFISKDLGINFIELNIINIIVVFIYYISILSFIYLIIYKLNKKKGILI